MLDDKIKQDIIQEHQTVPKEVIGLRVEPGLLAAIDAWREQPSVKLNRPSAMIALIKFGLHAWGNHFAGINKKVKEVEEVEELQDEISKPLFEDSK